MDHVKADVLRIPKIYIIMGVGTGEVFSRSYYRMLIQSPKLDISRVLFCSVQQYV